MASAPKAEISMPDAMILSRETRPASRLVVTDATGRHLTNGSLARPPTTAPPQVAPHPGPGGARCDWWWYTPYQPPPAVA